MFKDVAFGQYYPTGSVVHRMDPRMKLLLTIMFVVAIFFVNTYFGFMITAAVLLAIIFIARLPMLSVLKSVRAIVFIVLFASLVNLFMIKGGEVLWSWKSLQITDQGVHTTIKMALRLVLLICGASLLTLTTTPVEVADGTDHAVRGNEQDNRGTKGEGGELRHGRTYSARQGDAARAHTPLRQLLPPRGRTRLRDGRQVL